MLGTILKYTAVAFIGAVAFATSMHYIDENAYEVIKSTIDIQRDLFKEKGLTGDELTEAMRHYIDTNRTAWDGMYQLKETATRVQQLYADAVA